MSEFSLNLTDEQLQIKDWIHEFAKDVMRPAAQEWDDREEFPWPIVQEAAKIGLYGIDFIMNAMSDKSGLTMPVAVEEIFWGDGGIGMAIMGSGLAAAGISGNGTPEQVIEWVPQCYGDANDVKLGAFCVSEPDAGSDVSSLRTRAVYDEAGLLYSSDTRGSAPFYPRIRETVYRTPEIPSTLPTLDELMGRPEFPDEALAAHLLSLLRPDRLNVFTLHAEIEGMGRRQIFRDFLARCRGQGVEFIRLDEEAKRLLAHRESIPVCDQLLAPIDGRSGLVATQAA